MPLRCPGCHDILSPFDTGPVTLDRCASCGSLWIDPPELARVPEAAGALAGLRKAAANPRVCPSCCGTTAASAAACAVCKKPTATCPRCRDGALRAVVAGACTLCACSSCTGVWLGAGDLEAITRTQDLSSKVQDALEADPSSAAPSDGACARCAAPLARRTAWRRNRDRYCAACAAALRLSGAAAPRGKSRGGLGPGLAVLEMLGGVLDFIEGGLPPGAASPQGPDQISPRRAPPR